MTELERIIGYSFRDPELLRTALTHPSLSGESNVAHNQRLEFLGDAVLQLVMSARLYAAHPKLMEGELSRMRARSVNEKALHDAAERLGLGAYLLMSHGEELSGGRNRASVLADAVESVLGAIFLDGGLENARGFADTFLPIVAESVARDYKSELQEWMQEKAGITPVYRIVREDGPPHQRTFVANVLGNRVLGEGVGTSKKNAEQAAAQAALAALTQAPSL